MKRLVLLLAGPLLFAACDVAPTEPAADVLAPDGVRSDNGAYVARGAYPWDFGPAPIAVSCGDEEVGSATIGGTWWVRAQVLATPNGRVHWNELLDYADTEIAAGELTWVPGPGAYEKILWLGDGNGVRNVVHEFHARYLSQDGLPDLRVSHRIHVTRGPDGAIRHIEGVPPSFSAVCTG